MNTTNNAERMRARRPPSAAPAAHPKSGDGHAPNVARVFRPEAFASPAAFAPISPESVLRTRTASRADVKRTPSLGCPVGLAGRRAPCPLVTRHSSLACPEAWSAAEWVTALPFSNRDSKLLEIAVTYTKQTAEVPSNRDKIAPLTMSVLMDSLPIDRTKIRAKSDARR